MRAREGCKEHSMSPTSRTLSKLRLLPKEMLFKGPSSGSFACSSQRRACIRSKCDSFSRPASHASLGLRTVGERAGSELWITVPSSNLNASLFTGLAATGAGSTGVGAAISAMAETDAGHRGRGTAQKARRL